MKNLFFTLFTLSVFTQVHEQEANYADVNGVKIYYEVHGEGEPLVMLHGFTLSHKMWDSFVQPFSQKYKVILVDLRGHGHSTNPSNNFSHRESAKDVYQLMDALEINTFKGIGFSSGGMTLTHMAIMDTSRIKAMVLMGSSTSYIPEDSREVLRSLNYENPGEWMLYYMKQHQPGGISQIKSILAQWHDMAYIYDDMNFTPPYLSTIKASTLIIHGDRDPFFPVDIPVTSYNYIPNCYEKF